MKLAPLAFLALLVSALPCQALQQDNLDFQLQRLEQLRMNPRNQNLVNEQLYVIARINTDEAAEALEKVIYELPNPNRVVGINALTLNQSPAAKEVLMRLAKYRGDKFIRRQAVRVLANGDEADIEYLINKRLKYESDLRIRALILNLLLDRNVDGIDKHLLAAAKSKDTVYASVGVEGVGKRQLKRGLGLIYNALDNQDVQFRLAAYEALATYGGKKQFATLIEGLDDYDNTVLRADISAFLQYASTADEIDALINYCLHSDDIEIVSLCVKALAVVGKSHSEKCSEALNVLLNSRDSKIRSLSIEGLVKINSSGLQQVLVELLSHRDPQTQTDAAWGLSQLGNLPAEAETKLLTMADSERPSLRLQAINALKWFNESDTAYQVINDGLEDEIWSVRSAAVKSLVGFRRDDSLAPLLWLAENELGRVRSDALEALVTLTGEDFGPAVHTWNSWYADQGDSYKLPSAEEAEAKIAARKNKGLHNHTVAQSGYHGLAVPPGGVIFILDISGSMNTRYSSTESYYQHFSNALVETIQALGPEANFNIISFSTGLRVWKDKLVAADDKNRKSAKLWLESTTPGGATNIFGALQAAISFENVQTIFIMTDGSPSSGEYQLPDAIIAEIERLNRDRMIQINTIAAGNVQASFLADLAAANGGKTVDLTGKNKAVK